MTTEHLLNVLEDLREDEFRTFKWWLGQDDILEGFQAIRKFKLERADRTDTVDLMVETHGPDGALKVTINVLKKISRNDLVLSLQEGRKRLRGATDGLETASQEQDLSEKQLQQVARHIGRDWKLVGIHLDLSSRELDDIQARESNVIMQRQQMLVQWKSKRQPGQATARDLWESLKDLEELPTEARQTLQGMMAS